MPNEPSSLLERWDPLLGHQLEHPACWRHSTKAGRRARDVMAQGGEFIRRLRSEWAVCRRSFDQYIQFGESSYFIWLEEAFSRDNEAGVGCGGRGGGPVARPDADIRPEAWNMNARI